MNLTEVYQVYSLRVYRYMRYRVGNDQDAQDLTGAVFERAARRLDTFDAGKAAIDVWLFTIARNVLTDHFRRQRIRKWLPLEAAAEVVSTAKSPEQSALDREQFKALGRAIGTLKAREQNVVSLRYAADLRNVDIARVLSLSEKNVGVILHRALKKLKTQLEQEGIEYEG